MNHSQVFDIIPSQLKQKIRSGEVKLSKSMRPGIQTSFMVSTKVNLIQPWSISFNLGQYVFNVLFCFCGKQENIFHTFNLLFILLLLLIPTNLLVISPTIPSLLSGHPSPYSFYLNAYLISLEPQTFGYPLDSCPDALPVSHEDLDASSTIF